MSQTTLNLAALKRWTVYALSTTSSPDILLFVGYAQYDMLLHFEHARRNSEARKIVDQPGDFVLTILSQHDTDVEASAARDMVIDTKRPVCNIHGNNVNNTVYRGKVIHDRTGTVYDNATAAAESVGAATSNMSKHLRRLRGYGTCGGEVFSKVMEQI